MNQKKNAEIASEKFNKIVRRDVLVMAIIWITGPLIFNKNFTDYLCVFIIPYICWRKVQEAKYELKLDYDDLKYGE